MTPQQLISELPEPLQERSRLAHDRAAEGEFVLYWMRSAIRSEENPALETAQWFAERLGRPLLVYHGLSEHYRFASDRHHRFILEGARDVQRQFTETGIAYAFHLARPADRRRHLVDLAHRAAIVITEDMPVDPPRRFLNALIRSAVKPIVCVDTACVVPMQWTKQPYTRAFQFRRDTKQQYQERLTRSWPKVEAIARPFDAAKLPFEPIDLQRESLSELIAACEIDHAIGPVADTVGGSKAGYQRWEQFKKQRLGSYARLRNNALVDGVSRMSPYLHYGMVAPFRIAREAAEMDNDGGEKYLDELLIWRELAYSFCFHRTDHDQWTAIPEWARETLIHHASDRRENTYSWEELARGQTRDALWNAAQKSLMMHGELHNNVRMTWGKAILNWIKSPEQALETIIDLNHRYALDGRDPASYGGILWCLGQFDRPFEPEQPIIGTVRPRPTSVHAQRLDPKKYWDQIAAPRFAPVPHAAVIGAGISGLFAARTLADHGFHVSVIDKGRGVGGRMATRRVGEDSGFDHGAQYFTVRDPRFRRYVDSWIEQGLVAPWPEVGASEEQKIVVLVDGEIQSESNSSDRYVGQPGMTAIGKHLATDLRVQLQTRVAGVEWVNQQLRLFDDQQNTLGNFDRLIVSAPAAQAAELLVNFPALSEPISRIEMNPCWATMVSFDRPLTDQWVGAFLNESFLTWASRNSTKPGRSRIPENLVIHAGGEWTAAHWESDPREVADSMLQEFWRVSGLPPQPPIHLQSHRWKYAIPLEPSNQLCFFERELGIAVCGDWASGSRVEGAFLSGMAAAGRILGTLDPSPTRERNRQMQLFD